MVYTEKLKVALLTGITSEIYDNINNIIEYILNLDDLNFSKQGIQRIEDNIIDHIKNKKRLFH